MQEEMLLQQLCEESGMVFSRLKEEDLQTLKEYLKYCQEAESYMKEDDLAYFRSKAYIAVNQARMRRAGERLKNKQESTL